MQDLKRRDGVFFHEKSHERLLRVARPGNGDEKKCDREKKVPQPRPTAQRVNQHQRDRHRTDRSEHPRDTPLRVGFEKRLNSSKESQRGQREEEVLRQVGGWRRRWAVSPALQKQSHAKEGNEKTVAVLRIDLPISPKHPNGQPPHGGETGSEGQEVPEGASVGGIFEFHRPLPKSIT